MGGLYRQTVIVMRGGICCRNKIVLGDGWGKKEGWGGAKEGGGVSWAEIRGSERRVDVLLSNWRLGERGREGGRAVS